MFFEKKFLCKYNRIEGFYKDYLYLRSGRLVCVFIALTIVQINEDRTLQELMDKANQEKLRYEDEIRSLKVCVAILMVTRN